MKWEYLRLSNVAGGKLELELNALGADGWEAFYVSQTGSGFNVMFKRRGPTPDEIRYAREMAESKP